MAQCDDGWVKAGTQRAPHGYRAVNATYTELLIVLYH